MVYQPSRPPIARDSIYIQCLEVASTSGCKKMKFGAVIVDQYGAVVAKASNTPLSPLAHLCEPSCIRMRIASRTESMIGACAHAEELAMDKARAVGIELSVCDIYVAGLSIAAETGEMTPWLHDAAADHTCIRCTTQMYRARMKKIYVPTFAGWVYISAEDAVRKSALYALGEKSV